VSIATRKPTPASKSRPVEVMEELFLSDGPHQVDAEQGIVRHVKILGEESTNGRVYPRSCRAAAASMYEGVRVNVDHPPRQAPDQERKFGEWLGAIQNVTDEETGLFGDLYLLMSDPNSPKVMEAAQKMAFLFGLSHNAVTYQTPHDGKVVCTAIERVRSVDVVCKPATTRGIFESEGHMATCDKPVNEMRDMGADPMLDTTEAPAAEVVAESPDAGEAIKAELMKRVTEIINGEGSPADKAGQCKEAIEKIMAAHEHVDAALNGEEKDPAANESDDDDEPGTVSSSEESEKEPKPKKEDDAMDSEDPKVLKAALRKLKRENGARDALEAAGITVDKAKVLAVSAMESEDDRKALIATWKAPAKTPAAPAANVAKPKSRALNALESKGAQPVEKKGNEWDDPKIAAKRLVSA
jgi:hypothetical protein